MRNCKYVVMFESGDRLCKLSLVQEWLDDIKVKTLRDPEFHATEDDLQKLQDILEE